MHCAKSIARFFVKSGQNDSIKPSESLMLQKSLKVGIAP